MSLATKITHAQSVILRAGRHGRPLLAYSGGKDALVVALLMLDLVDFECVCETSFYFQRAEDDIRKTATTLGLCVRWRNSLDIAWIRRNPEILFADRSDIRSWSFAARQQRTVRKEQRIIAPGATYEDTVGNVAIFGRRREENSVRDFIYETNHGWQCHPLMDWSEDEVWSYLQQRNVPRPWIYSTEFGRLEGNAPFYTLRARDVGGVDKAWALVESLDPRYSRANVLGEGA